tara:strand:+ start:932 stop:1312 length:381 start_codon:yes stop_codon:yes gene_type:complete
MPNSLKLINQGPQQSHERSIHKDNFIFGMIGYVDHLICEQSDVQSVKNSVCARNCKIKFKMSSGVPSKSSDSPKVSYTKIIKRTSETASAISPLSICASVYSCSGGGHQFFVREQAFRSAKEEIKS